MKKFLKSDGQQCQQKIKKKSRKKTPNNSLSTNTKKTTTYDFENPGPGLRQVRKCGGIKQASMMKTISIRTFTKGTHASRGNSYISVFCYFSCRFVLHLELYCCKVVINIPLIALFRWLLKTVSVADYRPLQ